MTAETTRYWAERPAVANMVGISGQNKTGYQQDTNQSNYCMKIAAIIARSLLGLLFVVFGLNIFLNFIPLRCHLRPGPKLHDRT